MNHVKWLRNVFLRILFASCVVANSQLIAHSRPLVVVALPSPPPNSPACDSLCCGPSRSGGGECPASTVGPPACPRCTHWPGPASIHPPGRHSSISRSTQTPYRRRTPPLPSPSPVPTASRSSPPLPLSGARALPSRRLERQMASECHRTNPQPAPAHPNLPPPAALATGTSLRTPDHWQQSPATSMETD